MAEIMNFNPKGTGRIAEVLEGADAKTRALTRRIMAHVRKNVPDARAAAYPFWRVVMFASRNVAFCYVGPTKNGVNIGFNAGVFLRDPKGLLKGKAKTMRRVRINVGDQNIPWDDLTDLLIQARKICDKAAQLKKIGLG